MTSKYLEQYVPETPKSRGGKTNRVTESRVLSSTEGLAFFKEKEDKRKRIARKGRKLEREGKKKDKDDLANKKVEERLEKAAEKRNIPEKKSTSKAGFNLTIEARPVARRGSVFFVCMFVVVFLAVCWRMESSIAGKKRDTSSRTHGGLLKCFRPVTHSYILPCV